jgi:uncharacterized membrane protein
VPLLLGIIVAASFGTCDFLGGLASRRMPTLVTVGISQVVALLGAVVVAVVAGGDPAPHDLLLGGLAGLMNVAALGCLYQGLAIGQIGMVAPLAAVIGAVIPVAWALAVGERPSVLALFGVALAIVAGGLVSRGTEEPTSERSGRALLLAVGAGVGFGLCFICYAATSHDSGFWPVLMARTTAVVVVFVVLAVTRTRPTFLTARTERAPVILASGAGVLDAVATTLLLVAVRSGLAATVAPVAALAPGFTVAHARWYLHEQVSRTQVVGLVLALIGLALIAAG